MGEKAKNFITQFHNLQGETVKQRQENLFHLLHDNIELKEKPEELEFITSNLTPTTHLEKIFYVDYLIYFRQFKKNFENYRKGDEITVKKLSRQEWFFQAVIGEIGPEEFVNNFMPTISYLLKRKILNKIPLSENLADDFFNCVCERYGIFLAIVLLHKCTSCKIRETLTNYPIKLTESQLKTVFDKDPDLIDVYLEERVKHEKTLNFMNKSPIFKYIAQKNPVMFSSLFNKYHFDTSLGRRTTKTYLNSQKRHVLNDFQHYYKILNKSTTVRKMATEMIDVLNNNWDLLEFDQDLKSKNILQYFSKKQQFHLYKSVYDSTHYHKFGENIDDISEHILRLIPDPEQREMLAKLKMENDGKNMYLKYFKIDSCLSKVLEKLKHSTPLKRAQYIAIATECCILNKDFASLSTVCELVCVRFKNDHRIIRVLFFESLLTDENFLDELKEPQWKIIMEIFATARARDEWVTSGHVLVLKYLKYLSNNKKPIKEAIWRYYYWNDIFFHLEDKLREPKVHKYIIEELVEFGLTKPIPTELVDIWDKTEALRFDCGLVDSCKKYNERNPDDPVVFFNSRIFESIKSVLEEEGLTYLDSSFMSGIEYIICQPATTKELQQLRKLYFTSLGKACTSSGINWFLKNEPKVLQENFDAFLSIFTTVWGMNTKKLQRVIKKHDYLSLDERTVEFCRRKIGEKDYKYKDRLVKPLSMLSAPNSHLDFVKSFIPTTQTADLSNEDGKELYSLQGKMARLLHLVKSPADVLPIALEFCKGDYLRFGVSSLYSCMCKLPENETEKFITQLNDTKAISVRKHGLRLSCLIYDVETVHSNLEDTTVPSLVVASKYFAKNPSDKLWKLIKTKIENLKKNELEIFEDVLRINVPFKYRGKHMVTLWNVLEKYENKKLKQLLLTEVNMNVTHTIDHEQALKLIQNTIFKLEEAYSFVVYSFIYLKTNEKFDTLLDILTAFKKEYCESDGTLQLGRQKLETFVSKLLETYMLEKVCDDKFVTEMANIFNRVFSISEICQELIVIKSMALKEEDVEYCSKVLHVLSETFTKDYGFFAVNLIADTLNNLVFRNIFNKDCEKIKLCHFLLKYKESVSDYLLVIRLLPKSEPKYEPQFTLYQDILSQISRVSNDVVQLQFNSYLKSDLDPESETVGYQ